MSTRRALFFSFIDRYSGLVIAVASSMVIARLLPPSDLGVFSVAMALLMLASTVRDMGAGQYLVQTKELTPAKIKTVWTLQLSIGAGLAILVGALAIPAAGFYREPRMTNILWVMSLAYIVNPIGSVTYAMLMREMRFQHVAVMRFVAGSVGASVSIGLAYTGHGPISLAWGSLASTVANALTAQCFRSAETPWGFSFAGMREVLGFGGRIAGTGITNTLLSSTPDFALGKLQDMKAAGLYSRSNGLVSMFNRLVVDAVYNVAVSAFAAQQRAGAQVAPGFLRALSYVTVLNWVYAINLALLAQPITRILYGAQWDDSVQLTRWLALAGAFAAPTPICIAVCTAMGRADKVLKITTVTAVIAALAALLGAAVSLQVMGMAVSAAALFSSCTWLINTSKLTGCSPRELVRMLGHCAMVAGICGLVPGLLVLLLGAAPVSPWPILLVGTAAGAAALLLTLKTTRHALYEEFARLIKSR